MILIGLQVLTIVIAAILLGYKWYYALGLATAIVVLVSEHGIWKKGIEDKLRESSFGSMDIETSIRISFWFTVFFNFIIAFMAWPAVMLAKVFASFSTSENA